MRSPLESLLTTENFTPEEIHAIQKKLPFFTIFSHPFIFNEVWQCKALIAKDWLFFEELIEKEIRNPSFGPGILHYMILNGNTDLLNQALQKLGEKTFADACFKNSICMQPVVMAIFSQNLDMVKWVHTWQSAQSFERRLNLDPVLDILEKFHISKTHYSWQDCLDWLIANNPEMCTRLDLKKILSCLPDSEHLFFLDKHAEIFSENTVLTQLLLVTVQNKWVHILPWIENNAPVLQQFLAQDISNILRRSWEAECLDGLEFCYRHFKEFILNTKQVFLLPIHKPTAFFYPNSAMNIILKTIDKLFQPETLVFTSLILTAGWEIAIKARHQNWEPFIQKYISSEEATGITKTMWSWGTLENIRFCYHHFKHHLFTPNDAGKITPVLNEQWIKETMLMRYWSYKSLPENPIPEDPVFMEPFLKSGSANSICCHNFQSVVPLNRVLKNYFLLREFDCKGALQNAFQNKAARQAGDPIDNNVQHSLYQIEQSVKRNNQIYKRYPRFLKLCATLMFLQNTIVIPELVFQIVQFMIEIEKIRPVFGFFKTYETQMRQLEENNALFGLQPDQTISLA